MNARNKTGWLSSAAAAMAAASAMLLAGCGGGGGSSGNNAAGAAAGVPQDRLSTDTGAVQTATTPPALFFSANAAGTGATAALSGAIDASSPFFKPLGNGRSCATCHQQADGWSLTPENVRARFEQSGGLDPLFKAADAANSPLADVSTVEARRAAYGMLLNRGVIRMGLPIPANAEFELAAADDPYGFASAGELSLFRRPLPAANVGFLASVMWDARETYSDPGSGLCIINTANCYRPLEFNLANQAHHAVQGHAQAAAGLTAGEQAAIVEFEKNLFSAQTADRVAGNLAGAAAGGPLALSKTAFYFGINDTDAGDYRTRAPFNPRVFTLFDAWNGTPAADPATPPADAAAQIAARQSIARGQTIFNSAPIFLDNVPGLKNASVRGSCATCHNAPNVGSHSLPVAFNLGLSDASRRTPDLPLYTLRNKQTGETVQTTDPGAALATGKWQDVGRFKVPVLRGLAARAPYFHDGSAKTLAEVVDFYNERFKIGLGTQEAADLAAFLAAL